MCVCGRGGLAYITTVPSVAVAKQSTDQPSSGVLCIFIQPERERERGKEIRTVWMHLEPSAVAAAAVAAVVSS